MDFYSWSRTFGAFEIHVGACGSSMGHDFYSLCYCDPHIEVVPKRDIPADTKPEDSFAMLITHHDQEATA